MGLMADLHAESLPKVTGQHTGALTDGPLIGYIDADQIMFTLVNLRYTRSPYASCPIAYFGESANYIVAQRI